MAAQSIACPPLVTWIVPLLVRNTTESVFTRNASLETLLISPVFVTVRFATPELLSIARPVPVCWMVPLFISVDVPVMARATVEPLVLILPPPLTVPVPVERVCAPTVVVTGFGPGLNCAKAGEPRVRATAAVAM